jgi:hypothetical protein
MSNSHSDSGARKLLSSKQHRAVLLIASGCSTDEVADAAKVSMGTIHNWRSQNAEFRRAIADAQTAIYDDGIRQLQALVADACATLRTILISSTAKDHDRISAAKVVLQFVEVPRSPDSLGGAEYTGAGGFLSRMGLK